ncbi:Ankyrin repeat and SOCS box protein 8 [Balamuthia mandrillaris]
MESSNASAPASSSSPVELLCQRCLTKPVGGRPPCATCSAGYYCSDACQTADQQDHSALLCSMWTGPGDRINNPWYAPCSPSEPALLYPTPRDEELFEAARKGDVLALKKKCEQQPGAPLLLNVAREKHGETALHLAVASGNTEAVRLLLENGAFVNADDWYQNKPLYYACTHPGTDDVLKEDEAKRVEMVRTLVEAGADTMAQGGFSGMRSFQAARMNGHDDAADIIEESPAHDLRQRVRNQINTKRPQPSELAPLVKQMVDLHWRGGTADWFIRVNRDRMSQCFNPHPQLLKRFDGTAASVEAMFRDCQARHRLWWQTMVQLSSSSSSS